MKKFLLFLFCIFFLLVLTGIIFAAEPTEDEKRFYNVLNYRYNLHKDLASTSIDGARGTMENELVIRFPCPNPPPSEGKIKIKTKLVSWAGGEKAGLYEWKCSIGTDGNEKIMECENEISFDLDDMLPEQGLDRQTDNVGIFYHEWLHGQLLINAMGTPEWQAEFCKCNINWTPADTDDPHTTIPDIQSNFTSDLLNRTVTSTNPWNSTGNASDRDGDGTRNEDDRCPDSFDRSQNDSDEDGLGDSCDEDDDNDNIPDLNDNCPLNENTEQTDFDNDGAGDVCDNCLAIENTEQTDFDADGIGDSCDLDKDNDLIQDIEDMCPYDFYNDIDNDRVCGNEDNCIEMYNPDQEDIDRDGAGNICDNDSDNDGIMDENDVCPGTILTPISHGCSCFQILMIKPGPNHKEWIDGCSEKTIEFFENRRGWAKKYFSTHNT